MKGKLFLIPNTLGDSPQEKVLPSYNAQAIHNIRHFIVESEKPARQFLKKMNLKLPLQELQLYPLNEHTNANELTSYLNPIAQGEDMGLLSDAGCPGIADPGADIVKIAHKKGIDVVPLVGPSSIFLALMASGFNGQSFAFNGYLPRDRSDRVKRIKELENLTQVKKQSQIFIEAPYRNKHVFEDLLLSCDPNTQLCLAVDITLETEFIKSKPVSEWKKLPEVGEGIYKRPAIFILF